MLPINNITDLVSAADSPTFKFWQAVRQAERGKQILSVCGSLCDGNDFAPFDFLKCHDIPTSNKTDEHVQAEIDVKNDRHSLFGLMGQASAAKAKTDASAVDEVLQTGSITFTYEEVGFRLYVFTYELPFSSREQVFLLVWDGDRTNGTKFVADVHRWSTKLRQEVWVFNGVMGGWRKNKGLHTAIQDSQPDDLVLPEGMLSTLQHEAMSFFASQRLYQELGLTWKRGILLLGPPGNGKTGAIKVLAKACAQHQIPTLYVQTANTRMGPEYGATAIFRKARQEAPCILVLEDIETLVKGEMRTFLLNQLDGIESNDGVLVLATANDISQLDPAIAQRPSRFDTQYHFNLPNDDLRRRFISHWIHHKLGPTRFARDLALSDEPIDELVRRTDGWTFAFLKELFLSALLSFAKQNSFADSTGNGSMPCTLTHQDLLLHLEIIQRHVTSKDGQSKDDEQQSRGSP